MKPKTKSMTLTVALAAILALVAAQPCEAQTTWTVTSTDDDGAGTLRAALASAADGDTINFSLASTPATIALTSGALVVEKSVTITGPGQELLTVDAQGWDRVFRVYRPDWTLDQTVTISGLTIANAMTYYVGGGVYKSGRGALTLRDCTLSGNYARDGGGGVYYGGDGTLHITRCTLSDNTTYVSEDYDGGGAVLLEAVGFPDTVTRAALTIENSLLTGNTAPFGGAISIYVSGWAGRPANATVTVTDSTLSDNSASNSYGDANGGGIAINVTGDEDDENSWAKVTVENSTLSGNSAIGGWASGGGISISGQSTPSVAVTVRNSTLSGNWASAESGYGVGGAITASGGWLMVDNSTLSSNWATGVMGAGGAICALGGGVMVGNSTLSGNWAEGVEGGFGGGIVNAGHGVYIWNTILNAGQSGANLFNFAEYGGLFYSGGHNLSSDGGGGFLTDPTDQINTDPLLGPLANNGGPTFTHALLAGSPAINVGSAFDPLGNPVTTDQRGVARPQGTGHDIGAFEAELLEFSWSGVLPPVNPDGTSVFKAGSTIPVKFMLAGWSAGITDLVATLSYAKLDNNVAGPVNESVSTTAATTGNVFRYDPAAGQYVFNWSTKGLSAGTYRLFINLGDGVTRTVNLDLK